MAQGITNEVPYTRVVGISRCSSKAYRFPLQREGFTALTQQMSVQLLVVFAAQYQVPL